MTENITIVTVCYNAANVIEETVASVLMQSYGGFEYLIIDGSSSDGTVDVVKQVINKNSLKNKCNVNIIVQHDNGIFDAMNKALGYVTDESYVLFLNAGDTFYNAYVIERVVDIIKNVDHRFDVIYGDIFAVGKTDKTLVHAGNYLELPQRMPFSHQAVFARAELLKKNKFSLSFQTCADYNQFLSLYMQGAKFFYCGVIISNYLLGGFSASNPTLLTYEKLEVRRRNGVITLLNPKTGIFYMWTIVKLKLRQKLPDRYFKFLKKLIRRID